MKSKILIVDDDTLVRRTCKYRLEREGFEVTTAETGSEAIACVRQDRPDLVVLDIGLPDQDGLSVARTISRETQTPIMFLTARNQDSDVVLGLELGAEDYVTKPFGMNVLVARIRAVLRRREQAHSALQDNVLIIGEVMLDPKGHTVTVRGSPVDLPPKEFELLRLLMANAGTVLTTDYLLDAVWGQDYAGALQVLYVRIGWLRDQVERDPRHPCLIQTVRGVGYKFAAGGEPL